MRSDGFEKPLASEVLVDLGRHPVIGICLAVLRIPEVMGDKLQQQRLGRRPGQRFAGGGQSPGFEIGQIGGQRPQRVVAHAIKAKTPTEKIFLLTSDICNPITSG